MSNMFTIAKFTLAFVVIAVGLSLIAGTLIGGGSSRGYDAMKAVNKDPRSIYVQAVLIETGADISQDVSLPSPDSKLSDAEFDSLVSQARSVRGVDGVQVKTPAMLVQHGESGNITVQVGDRSFDASVSPRVIDTKRGAVLRIALQIQREDTDSSSAPRELKFSTAFTSAPGSVVVFDLAGLGIESSRAVLALRTTLIDPTPVASN